MIATLYTLMATQLLQSCHARGEVLQTLLSYISTGTSMLAVGAT